MEEVQRLDSLYQQIFDGRCEEIDSDIFGDFELCANVICARNENSVLLSRSFKVKDPTEAAQAWVAPQSVCPLCQWFDEIDESIASRDRHARGFTYHSLASFPLPMRSKGQSTVGNVSPESLAFEGHGVNANVGLVKSPL